jgi:LysM repeat protein
VNRLNPIQTLLVVVAVVAVVFAPAVAQAGGGGCSRPYTVRPGDTLSGIANLNGSTVAELAQLNRIANPDRIYAGQVLCLPAEMPNTPGVPSPTPEPKDLGLGLPVATSHIDLVAEYRIDTSVPDDDNTETWTLGQEGLLVKRVSFSLPSGDAIRTYAGPDEVRSESEKDAPLWWLVRSRAAKPYTYTLVMIGSAAPLLALQLKPSATLTDTLGRRASTPNVLGDGVALADDVNLRFELVAPDGTAIPVTISAVQYLPAVRDATQAQPFPAFALQTASGPGQAGPGYELLMVLNDDGTLGPPGRGWSARCSSWASGGWWYRFLRRFYRC